MVVTLLSVLSLENVQLFFRFTSDLFGFNELSDDSFEKRLWTDYNSGAQMFFLQI